MILSKLPELEKGARCVTSVYYAAENPQESFMSASMGAGEGMLLSSHSTLIVYFEALYPENKRVHRSWQAQVLDF